jgi:hypothetical protein
VQQVLTCALVGFYTHAHMTALSLPYYELELPQSPYAAVAREASRRATRVLAVVDPMPEGWQWEPFEEWLGQTDPAFSEIDPRSFGRLELRVYGRQSPQPN